MENQIIEGYKTGENANTSKKEVHKELGEDAASKEELGENQERNTEICGKETKTCEKSEGKQKKSEQNKEESGQMIKDIKKFEEHDRKDNNLGVSRNKSNENETKIHKKLKVIIQTMYHISKTRKGCSEKDGEAQMKEKHTK